MPQYLHHDQLVKLAFNSSTGLDTRSEQKKSKENLSLGEALFKNRPFVSLIYTCIYIHTPHRQRFLSLSLSLSLCLSPCLSLSLSLSVCLSLSLSLPLSLSLSLSLRLSLYIRVR